MGTTFSTIQIRNNLKLDPEQFKKSLCGYFEKKGLACATEEDFQFSYRLAFSDKSDWVTLSCAEYVSDMKLIQDDAQGLAKALKAHCIITSVWDSDFIELHLFGSTAKQRDYLWAGRHIADDCPEEKGEQKQWEPLLVEGKTWEQFSEILDACDNNTFAEDTLSEIAPLLGMDSEKISMDYDKLGGTDSPNIINLYFKEKVVIPLLIQEGATKLVTATGGYFISGRREHITFYNIGGVSKGLGVFFIGDCFKNSDVEISELEIRRLKKSKVGKVKWRDTKYPDDFEIFNATLTKKEFQGGKHGLIAYVDEYEFLEGINLEHPSMVGYNRTSNKSCDIINAYSTSIHYTATVFSGLHKVYFGVAPLSNWIEGQASNLNSL